VRMRENRMRAQRQLSGMATLGGSRYLRCTTMLQEAGKELHLPGGDGIRRFSDCEAAELQGLLLKRNVYARHSWENNFYLQRAGSLAGRTAIEIQADGDPHHAMARAAEQADLLEMLAVLSSTFATQRTALHRLLAITARPVGEVDLIHSNDLRYVRSHTRSTSTEDGIRIDERFARRFSRLGFISLYDFCRQSTALSNRVQPALNWLFESRKESNVYGAVVKSVIALETLLISSESEPLTKTLSERMAFLLGENAKNRERISHLAKRIYAVRSGIVHGGKRKLRDFSGNTLESMDRFVLLGCLAIASNTALWPTMEALRQWFENERWSAPSLQVALPFPRFYLRRALELGEKRPRKDG